MPTKVIRYEFDDGSDVEFVPIREGHSVQLNGVHVACLEKPEKPSRIRALYYHDVFREELPRMLGVVRETPAAAVAIGA